MSRYDNLWWISGNDTDKEDTSWEGMSMLRCFHIIPLRYTITYSVLISYCFALYPYEKQELIKPE